ncbi:MAG: hypothetical protein WCI74_14890 [Actinomycetes bacterium]
MSVAGPVNGYPGIVAALVHEDYPLVIDLVRQAVAENPVAALSDPQIKSWLGRRYRNLFLVEAGKDKNALRTAKVPLPLQLIDGRSGQESLAKRFLKGMPRNQAAVRMPPAVEPDLRGITLLFVPGLMTGLLPVRAFQSVWPLLEDRFGVRVLGADVHPVRSCAANEEDIITAMDTGVGWDAESQRVSKRSAKAPTDVILLGYSKGATDALNFLVDCPQYRDRIRAFVSWAGIIGGSYIADDIAARLKDVEVPATPLSGQISKLLRQIVPVVQADRVNVRLEQYEVKAAVAEMTTAVREQWLREHIEDLAQLGIPTFTVAGVTSVLEVPYYQAVGAMQLNNYNKYNDMLLTVDQTRLPIPQATELATFRGHHWDLGYDPFPWFTRMGSLNVDHRFARYPALAALLLFLAELGLLG